MANTTETEYHSFGWTKPPRIMISDEIDRRLLARLQEDGATPYAELGALVGLSASSVNERLRKLRAKGHLRRVTAEIDPAAFGLEMLAFVLVVVETQEAGFRASMQGCAEVMECHHVTGEFSYLLKLRMANAAALERFLADHLKALPGIGRTHTLIALSSVKETHVLPTSMSKAAHP